jgi:flagellar biosynthesis anti-sigma factor FlgM
VIAVHISNSQIQKVLELHLHKVNRLQEKPTSSSSRGPDQLILSGKAAEMQKIKQQITGLPQVRANIVQELRQKLDSGRYDADSTELVESMFSSAVDIRSADQ